ncbi:MAG: cation diffusion facilitator family transporter [Frankiaceae bacterium]
MSAEGSLKAVIAALLANLGIAVAKFAAAIVTGSSSMLAEAIHSVADTGNQGLLLLGNKRGARRADAEHPFGYGRDRYVYAFLVAVVLFSLGGLFAIYEGIEKLRHPHEIEDAGVAIAVLVVAVVLESLSFRTVVRESNRVRGGDSWVGFVRHTKIPELPVVLLEDFAALIGLFFALVGVGLTLLTGNPRWDAVGTLLIGVLLACVAVVLGVEMKGLLIGEAAAPETERRIRRALEGTPKITRLIHLRTLHLGPEEVLVAAKVEIDRTATVPEVAQVIDDAEMRVRSDVPIARVMYLEPDLWRSVGAERSGAGPG